MDTKSGTKRCKGGSPNQKRKKAKRTENPSFVASTSKSHIERSPGEMAEDGISESGADSAQISLLVRALKTVISEPISALRKTADQVYEVKEISRVPPSSKDAEAEHDISTGVDEKKPTLLVEDKEVSFRFPTDVNLDGLDIDKLEPPRGCNPQASKDNRTRRFFFSERLKEWRIERRLRFNGRRDMFYHHRISRESFRSVVEVINFIMYEVCPRKKEKQWQEKRSLNDSGLNETANNPIVIEESSPARSISLEEIDGMIDSTQKMETQVTKDEENLIDHIPVCKSVSELINPNQTKG